MIFLIIFGALILFGIVLIILDKVVFDTDVIFGIGIFLSILGGVGALTCTGVAAVEHSEIFKNSIRIECQERIESLNNSRSFLEKKIESNTVTVLEINTYNDSVREFKTELTKRQLELDSYWIGLYTCPAYDEFSPDAVSYLYVEDKKA